MSDYLKNIQQINGRVETYRMGDLFIPSFVSDYKNYSNFLQGLITNANYKWDIYI